MVLRILLAFSVLEGCELRAGTEAARLAEGRGAACAVAALYPAPAGPVGPVIGKCETCNGTGQVGDGRVFSKCLECNGDGRIDEEDLRREDKPGWDQAPTDASPPPPAAEPSSTQETIRDLRALTERIEASNATLENLQERLQTLRERGGDGKAASPPVVAQPPVVKGLVWQTDYATAWREALREGKPLLIYLDATTCPNCPAFEKRFLEAEATHHELSQWVLLWSVVDQEPEMLARMERWQQKLTGSSGFEVPKLFAVSPKQNLYNAVDKPTSVSGFLDDLGKIRRKYR